MYRFILIVIVVLIVLFFSFNYLVGVLIYFGGEHGYSKEGLKYTMYNVEVLKRVNLKKEKQKITYDFISKKDSQRLSIKFHFDKLKPTELSLSEDPRIKKLLKHYEGTRITLVNETNHTVLSNEVIERDNYSSIYTPDITIWVASAIKTHKGDKCQITIELPFKQNIDTNYNTFLLVVGNLEDAWL